MKGHTFYTWTSRHSSRCWMNCSCQVKGHIFYRFDLKSQLKGHSFCHPKSLLDWSALVFQNGSCMCWTFPVSLIRVRPLTEIHFNTLSTPAIFVDNQCAAKVYLTDIIYAFENCGSTKVGYDGANSGLVLFGTKKKRVGEWHWDKHFECHLRGIGL